MSRAPAPKPSPFVATDGLTHVRTPLHKDGWAYAEGAAMEAFDEAAWTTLNRQRDDFFTEYQTRTALKMLQAMELEPSFGYQINIYRHGLQTATMLHRAGYDEEAVVVALLHDIGFTAAPITHGRVAAAMLGPYISADHYWMLEHHQVFQDYAVVHLPSELRNARERWRGHAAFEWTCEFVDKYDQVAIRADIETMPLRDFEPMVQRFFRKPPHPIVTD